jgi:hypothetical protein
MTTMTMRPQARTHPALVQTETQTEFTLIEEILGWSALASFAAVCYLVFAIAIWV